MDKFSIADQIITAPSFYFVFLTWKRKRKKKQFVDGCLTGEKLVYVYEIGSNFFRLVEELLQGETKA